MNFASDNAYGAMPEILEALFLANEGPAASYGEDDISKELTQRFADVFERPVAIYPVVTGTAANALALATLCPLHGAIFCHAQSHIATDECGAPEFYTHGAKLILLDGKHGKIAPSGIEAALPGFKRGVHSASPSVVSITQLSELGTVYTVAEIAALAESAHANGMRLHMDGARFANALVSRGCTPAEMTWKAGVDVLSFGATKNGALAAEAVIFFDPSMAADFEYRRKKSGHLLSKLRFVSAQLKTYLGEDRWLRAAGISNALARKLGEGLSQSKEIAIVHSIDGNAVFARLPNALIAKLREAGASFYDWAPSIEKHTVVRLVTSFTTPEKDVERFLDIARNGAA